MEFNDPFNSFMIMQFSRIIDVINKPLKIADMGCGFGNSSLSLASIFPQATVHGLDIDEDSIAKAKANINHPNVTFTGKYLYFSLNITTNRI